MMYFILSIYETHERKPIHLCMTLKELKSSGENGGVRHRNETVRGGHWCVTERCGLTHLFCIHIWPVPLFLRDSLQALDAIQCSRNDGPCWWTLHIHRLCCVPTHGICFEIETDCNVAPTISKISLCFDTRTEWNPYNYSDGTFLFLLKHKALKHLPIPFNFVFVQICLCTWQTDHTDFGCPSICWKTHSGKSRRSIKFSPPFPDISVFQWVGQREKLLYRKLKGK